VSLLLAAEATRDLALGEAPVQTPLERTIAHTVSSRVVAVPVLRAGIGMLEAFLELVPQEGLTVFGVHLSAVFAAWTETRRVIELRALLDRYGYGGDLYGHFGQGCVHTRTDFDLVTPDGIAKFRAFIFDAADLVIAHGGSISGEHGDGQSRAELLPKMFGPELVEAFREFKATWDPDGLMNPGKIVNPYRADENLRHGGMRRHLPPETAFAYASDGGSFARALQRREALEF